MKNYLIFVCISIVQISCGDRQLRNDIKQLTASEISMPEGIKHVVNMRDSLVNIQADNAAKLVVWVDSAACSTCRIDRLFEYEVIVEFREEIGDEFVPVFLFSPPQDKIDEVIKAVEFNELDCPVFIDENHAFPAMNPHIPADNRFHTFLIDKNGKVVLVGNPVNNPALWELYKTTITTLIENGGTMPPTETEK
jgi:hypothetical protein